MFERNTLTFNPGRNRDTNALGTLTDVRELAPGVLKEVAMAIAIDKRRFQVIGYRNGSEDWAVPGADRTCAWSWDNLKKLLA